MTCTSPLVITAMLASSDTAGRSRLTVVSVCNAILAVVVIVYWYFPGAYTNFHGPLVLSGVCTPDPGLATTAGTFAAGFEGIDGVVTTSG